jgi:hypothetical protein
MGVSRGGLFMLEAMVWSNSQVAKSQGPEECMRRRALQMRAVPALARPVRAVRHVMWRGIFELDRYPRLGSLASRQLRTKLDMKGRKTLFVSLQV